MSPLAPPRRYLVAAIGLAVVAVIEGVLASNGVVTIVAGVIAALALAWVRVAPVAVAGIVLIAYAVAPATGTSVTSVVPFFVSLAFVGRYATRWAGVGVAVGATLVLGLTDVEGTDSLSQLAANLTYYLLMSTVLVGGGQLLAYGARREGELADQVRDLDEGAAEREQAAVAAERARMARELHDVVAHALTIIGVHAAVARINVDRDPCRAATAIDRIEQGATQASDEMRRLLGLLRHHDGEPLPRLARLDELVEASRAAGLEVTSDVTGLRDDLSPGLDLAAYRIVQEALSNVRRHAPGARVQVQVIGRDDCLELEVVDDGGTGSPAAGGSGYGLIGLRERAALYGGRVEAGPRPNGGFALRAVLPLVSSVASPPAG